MRNVRTSTSVMSRYEVPHLSDVSIGQVRSLRCPAAIKEIALTFRAADSPPYFVELNFEQGMCTTVRISQEYVKKSDVIACAERLGRLLGATPSRPETFKKFNGERHEVTLSFSQRYEVDFLLRTLSSFFESKKEPEVRSVLTPKASPSELEALGFCLTQMPMIERPTKSPGTESGAAQN